MKKNQCTCLTCGHTHLTGKRLICLFDEMCVTLARIYKWSVENDKKEFDRKEIKHLLNSENDTARLGDWVYFGGLLLKTKDRNGWWTINHRRCQNFFSGQTAIFSKLYKDRATGVIEKFDKLHASEMPPLRKFLDDNGLYKPDYVPPSLFDQDADDEESDQIKDI